MNEDKFKWASKLILKLNISQGSILQQMHSLRRVTFAAITILKFNALEEWEEEVQKYVCLQKIIQDQLAD